MIKDRDSAKCVSLPAPNFRVEPYHYDRLEVEV